MFLKNGIILKCKLPTITEEKLGLKYNRKF